jgi:hypothetical protein
MSDENKGAFRERVRNAAEAALKAHGSVGPLELLQRMGFLYSGHFVEWQRGAAGRAALESCFQVGPEKLGRTLRYFAEWVGERGLEPIEAPYTRRTARGMEELRVTADGNPEREKFYRTRFVPKARTEARQRQIRGKVTKAPDLVVFEKVSEEGNCSECGAELLQGNFLVMEKGRPLCLACADMDHLVFLPAGDTALSRRSRKHSQLSAVVVHYHRSRRRYERQGLLVTAEGLARAEQECAADVSKRARRREKAVFIRQAEDREFVGEMVQAIASQYPGCPAHEAQAIARHTALRGSGRVGRSAAGRALEPQAIELAVRAHVRHAHTNYDALLMGGADRQDARALVRDRIDQVMAGWRRG